MGEVQAMQGEAGSQVSFVLLNEARLSQITRHSKVIAHLCPAHTDDRESQ